MLDCVPGCPKQRPFRQLGRSERQLALRQGERVVHLQRLSRGGYYVRFLPDWAFVQRIRVRPDHAELQHVETLYHLGGREKLLENKRWCWRTEAEGVGVGRRRRDSANCIRRKGLALCKDLACNRYGILVALDGYIVP